METLEKKDLDNALQTLYKIYGKFGYLFLDEIQNIDGWPLFVDRLLRQKIHIVLTGSNANLLSSELATHLTGRHHQVCYDISNDRTRTREVRGRIAGAKATKCDNLFLITDHESGTIAENGYAIQVMPIWEWLTKEEL